jgi:glycosyltransferase involved in cell wall biosynthesis
MPPNDAELVVFSHLRWTFVWQRPQHLISRLARTRRTWFVEEPVATDAPRSGLQIEEHGPVTRAWLEVPGPERHVWYTDPAASTYGDCLLDLLAGSRERTVWLYTPMALPLAQRLEPSQLVYDVMDDLAAFALAPPELRELQRQALEAADVVFTGGRSLHATVTALRPQRTYLFPSGVEPEHFANALRYVSGSRQPPVAGYVGVIDERLDLPLVADLAAALPDWEIRMVGPVVKIDPATLPKAPNLTYPGLQPYDELPAVLAEFDVALMPFALNEATRAISPTKTLEYLAAGLPVVSTRVPDVVADHSDVVELCDDGIAFAQACELLRHHDRHERVERARPLLQRQCWDAVAARMQSLLAPREIDLTLLEERA